MNHALTIAKREIVSLFSTPLGWILMGLHLVLTGYFFFGTLQAFVGELDRAQGTPSLERLNLNEWVIFPSFATYEIVFIVLIPILTMRAFAEERANGTIELLLTSPVTSTELVAGKYLAILAMVGLMVCLSALYPIMLFAYGDPELLQTLSGLLGLFLLGSALGALGCFTSTLTRSPAVAAIVAIIAGFILLIANFFAEQVPPGWFASLIRYIGLSAHFEGPMQGLIRSQDLVYFGVFIAFFLALSKTGVESMRVR